MLTEEQEAEAEKLGLTRTEMEIALATDISPVIYARHRAELNGESAAWEAKMGGVETAAAERVAAFGPDKPAVD